MAGAVTLSRRASELVGIVLFAAALLWLVSLATHSPADPAWFFTSGPAHVAPDNFAGRIGAFLSELSLQLFGYAAFLIPLVLLVIGWTYFWCSAVDAGWTKLFGALLLFACVATMLALAFSSDGVPAAGFAAGGYLGEALASWLSEYLNRTGSLILVLTFTFLSVIMATQLSLGRIASSAGHWMAARAAGLVTSVRARREEQRRTRERQEIVRKHIDRGMPADEAESRAAAARAPARRPRPERAEPLLDDEPAPARPGATLRPSPAPALNVAPPRREPARAAASLPLAEPETLGPTPAEKKGVYTFPPLTLLDAPRGERKFDERELMEAARLLEDKFREFAVDGNVVQIHPGPVVTTFEFKPDAGVKYSKITNLADDLSLAMQAESVLIDRIPGKSTVGIQIPNVNREHISLRELLETEAYRKSSSKLSMTLGKTIHGEPFIADLATMPHLLIAGSTGTGKSVGLNAMVTSILYRATPEDVRLIMVDPKRLELGMYEDIPHLLTPVVVDPKLAANALRWAVREMEERYKTLAAQGVRNIEQYNRNVRHLLAEGGDAARGLEGEPLKPLPFIVVVIDELADLMMVAGNEVEESICRLAQMARAVGIHLILATQRPSVDVITGLIKANLPSRISFRVSSKIDSRTVLDTNGAEQLLGKGDMLFQPPASSRAIRLHGPYISEQESARLASFLRKQGKPVYNITITEDDKPAEALEFEKDTLYDDAARIVVQSGQASISYLQRRLRIGFSRAARLIDMMEAEGLVSPGAGGKQREVLVGKDYFDEIDATV
ncbi:MAG: DNA translocase FtsK [Vicinamibacteraceae bacterium]|nr:DNA translocase FtsK [Vicinamibacteraceae bacterium]